MYVDVILPLALPGTFTYEVPEGHQPVVGGRVVVPFGKGRKQYGAIVVRLHEERPLARRARPLISVLDERPMVTRSQLELWQRVASHYMCSLGEVLLAALPTSLNLSSETKLMAGHTDLDVKLTPREAILLNALEARQQLTMGEASDLLGVKDPMPRVERLMALGVLVLAEEVHDRYKPRMVRYVRLSAEAGTEEALRSWFDRLERAPKQLHVLMKYIELSRCLSGSPREVARNGLLAGSGATAQVLRELCTKGVLEEYERPAGAPDPERSGSGPPSLSAAQEVTMEKLQKGLQEHAVALLRGVTSSGKTEIYMKAIEEQLAQGRQVLYLLPEIALTTQVIGRLEARFGDRIHVHHSRLGQRSRTALWERMLREPASVPIIIGARSALFLPFSDLGLVIVDEEHDPSYKQQDPAPRYHGRDMAIVLASIHGARTILGSATPSVESRFNAAQGRYAHAELLVRHADAPMPEVVLVDMREARKRRTVQGHFSQQLLDAMQRAMARREQVIIFQNRRGYVPVWQCETCGWVPECDDCDVSLTYHKHEHALRCHYCGKRYTPPTSCGQCAGSRLRMIGLGTERIEEELALHFPEARIARMDQDTTRSRQAFSTILERFAEGDLDILVGTQMVTKGLDFARVSVVGIPDADALLRHPDLRAHERAFQLMAQVAGRSGRGNTGGTVYIQARDVGHPVFRFVLAHDAEGMYERELLMRRDHGYPPYTRLVRFTLKHRVEERVAATAQALTAALHPHLRERVLGPETPAVGRVRDLHIRNVMVKLLRNNYRNEKAWLAEVVDRLFSMDDHARVRLIVDVDPY